MGKEVRVFSLLDFFFRSTSDQGQLVDFQNLNGLGLQCKCAFGVRGAHDAPSLRVGDRL